MKFQILPAFLLVLPCCAWAACQPLDIATANAAIKAQKGPVNQGVNSGETALYTHKFSSVQSINCNGSLNSCDLKAMYSYTSVNRVMLMPVSANCVQDQWVFTLPNDKPSFK